MTLTRLRSSGSDATRVISAARTEDLPISFRGASLDDGERFSAMVYERRFAQLDAIHERQRDVMRAASLLTSLVAVQNLSAALAGTDNAHARDFAAQAEDERRTVVNRLNRDLTVNGAGQATYRADEQLWRAIEPFRPQATPLDRALAAVWPDMLILGAWALLAFALLLRAGRALDRESV